MLGNYEAALLLITLAREAVGEVHGHLVVCAPVLSEVGEGPEHDIRAAARRSPDEVSPLRVASAELGQAPHEPPREANRHALVPHRDHEHQVRSHCRRGVPGLTDWRVRRLHKVTCKRRLRLRILQCAFPALPACPPERDVCRGSRRRAFLGYFGELGELVVFPDF